MFPLGSVLFPFMPLPLRVFEERYLVMLSRILGDDPAEFGVVLIERGQEVGGGEHRFGVGTVAQITELDESEGMIVLVARGGRRIRVDAWGEDDPFPLARVEELPDLVWHDDLLSLYAEAELAVRVALSDAAERGGAAWPADIELADDPLAASWQLAGVAPLGSLDQVALLGVSSAEELLTTLIELVAAAREVLDANWPDANWPDANWPDADWPDD